MKKNGLYICLGLFILLSGCSSSGRTAYTNRNDQEKYTSAFPSRDVSTNLGRIQRSVRRYTSTATYRIYSFGKKNITHKSVQKYGLEKLTDHKSEVDRSKAGTAISILKNENFTAFVSVQHVLAFPDTLWRFKQLSGVANHTFLRSVGVKINQKNYIYSGGNIKLLSLIGTDKNADLALLSINDKPGNFNISPAPLKIGNAHRLQPGSFVYVIGYPLGTPMVTRALVSAPDYDDKGEFLTDGLFNHGISGGMIIASQNDFRSFEWVGMASRASATDDSYLVPNPRKATRYSNLDAYSDTVFVKKTKRINYGVTQAISINQILFFLYRNEDALNKLGLSAADWGHDK